MNRTTCLIILIISNFSFGQLISSRIEKAQVLDESLNHALVGVANKRLVSFSEKKDQLNIDIYDTDSLNLLYHEQMQLFEDDKYDLEVQGVYRVKDEFKLVATGFSNNTDQFGLFIYSIQEDGKLGKNFQKVLFPERSESAVSVRSNIRTNPDQTLLLVHLAFVYQFQDVVDHQLFVYNEKLKNLFTMSHEAFPASTVKEKYALSYCIGANHLYELRQDVIYTKSIKKYQAVLNLNKYDFKGEEKVYTQSIKLGDGFMLSDLRIKEVGEQLHLFASFLASSKKTITGIRGVYMAQFNRDLTVSVAKAQNLSQATRAKSLRGYDNTEMLDIPQLYELNHCLTDSAGNTYLLYERTSETSSYGVHEFYYGSIIAVKINPQGILEWDTFIAKSQYFTENAIPIPLVVPHVGFAVFFSIRFSKDSRQYLSFKPLMKNNELYFIYNDNPENEGKTAGQERKNMTNIKQSVPFVIHLSPKGNVEYQILKNLKIGTENQRIVYSVLDGTTLFTLRDSGKQEVLQRIVFE